MFDHLKEVDCNWGNWEPWTPCSAICGGGVRITSRRNTVTERNGGSPCNGSFVNTEHCNQEHCSETTQLIKQGIYVQE